MITLVLGTFFAVFLVGNDNPLAHAQLSTIREHGINVYGGNITTQDGEKYIDWGVVYPGTEVDRSFYVESEGNEPVFLVFKFRNWVFRDSQGYEVNRSLAQYMTPCSDYNSTLVNPDEKIQVTITLRVSNDRAFIQYLMDEDVTEFSFDIHIYAETRTYLLVRGLNDKVYYRAASSANGSWQEWYAVPSGATCDSPAASIRSGRLYMVVRGLDGYSLWFGWINLVDDSFSGWKRLSGASGSAPTLVSYDSRLFLIIRGLNNLIYYRNYNCTTDTWNDWQKIPTKATCDSPAATVTGDTLHVIVRGFSSTSMSENQSLWHSTLNLTDKSFSGWTRLPGATPSAPTLATSESSGDVHLVVRGLNNVPYVNAWDGNLWAGWKPLAGATCDSPAATVTVETLQIVVRGITGTSLWYSYMDLNTSDSSNWNIIKGATRSSPTLIK